MRTLSLTLSAIMMCCACSSDGDPEPVDESLVAPPAEGEGFQFSMDAVAPAGS